MSTAGPAAPPRSVADVHGRLAGWWYGLGVPSSEARMLGLVWAGSRAWLLLVLLLVVVALGRHPLDALASWDVLHFMAVATSGYSSTESRAFFPGLPGLMDAGAMLGVRMEVTGALVGLIGSLLAGAALYAIARDRLGRPLAVLPAALWWWAPATVFTFVGYTEAPFCAAAFWAWQRWRRGHWLSGASLAAIACTFRVSGLFLIGALVVLTLLGDGDETQVRPTDPVARVALLRWLLLPVAVLVAHAWHLEQVTGSWTAWYQAQVTGWNRGLTPPWQALANTWQAARPSSWPGRAEVPVVFGLEIVSMLVGVVATMVLLRRRWWASAAWMGVHLVAFGTSYWYMSLNRAVLLWFPLFLLLAEWLQGTSARVSGRRVALITGWFVLSGLAAGAWAWLLFTHRWAS